MAECIESGECFSALLFLQISDFFGIVPAGLLSEWTLYPRAFLPDDSEAGTFYARSFVVPNGVHNDQLSRDSAPESDRAKCLPNVCGSGADGAGGNPSCEGMAHRQGANRARAQVKDP